MKVINIDSYETHGRIILSDGVGGTVSIPLKTEECAEVIALAWKIFQRQQKDIAETINNAAPLALSAPSDIQDAEFTEASF